MPPRSVCARVLRRDEQPTTNGIRSLPHLSLMVVRCPKGSVRVQLAARSRSLHSLYDLTTEAVQMTTSSSDPRGLRLLWILISLSAMALAGCKENAGAGAGGDGEATEVSTPVSSALVSSDESSLASRGTLNFDRSRISTASDTLGETRPARGLFRPLLALRGTAAVPARTGGPAIA